ncbi:phosphate ABC transporter substrate-binding protein [Halioglobus japonicus]|uniref:Phosphate ABC transporter substrate-binding protein n=1 Tax=Halioglobus japonicus TaxID=930805 RepID=A0AAP8MFE8_9GAMM|nr:phosphate ABC transporter substrate-binding protein [Halioglobus japonicus]PLW86860.1 phosphate ABC transporter substrate-binding protein [Halioglobus japonicus]GHD23672.1 phosphate ABC transporter substrate-binding protein [Halioglobus japonicus]
MKKQIASVIALAAAIGVVSNVQAQGRDTVSIVGSSTVYPFATVVAERFGRSTDFKTPKIESTGSGGGLKLFCKGLGAGTPDITNASRRIKKSEFDDCQQNGVTDILEVLVGYDGIAIANSRKADQMELSLKDIYMALAKDIPGPDGKLMPNPYTTWKDVNPALPAIKIEVLGPPPTSGTRDAFAELALGGGAQAVPALKTLRGMGADDAVALKAAMASLGIPAGVYDSYLEKKGKAPKGKDIFKTVAYAVREDGAYIEAGENDNLIVQKLEANPNALGIFGFSFLDENGDKVQGSLIDGVAPSFDTIADGDYPVSRPLYFYVKAAHVGKIPGIQEYAAEFASNKAMGEDGYLPERGLIPLGDEELAQAQKDVASLKLLKM